MSISFPVMLQYKQKNELRFVNLKKQLQLEQETLVKTMKQVKQKLIDVSKRVEESNILRFLNSGGVIYSMEDDEPTFLDNIAGLEHKIVTAKIPFQVTANEDDFYDYKLDWSWELFNSYVSQTINRTPQHINFDFDTGDIVWGKDVGMSFIYTNNLKTIPVQLSCIYLRNTE
jgi:hypothetical protein